MKAITSFTSFITTIIVVIIIFLSEYTFNKSSKDKNYIIILNNDQEAMPGVGGLLKVEAFSKNEDTVWVQTVEE